MSTSLTSTATTLTPHGSVRCVDDALEHGRDLVAAFEHVGELRLADDVAQRGLRRPADRAHVVGHRERRLLGVDHLPEQHGVDVDRDRVLRQRLLRLEGGGDHAGVDPVRDGVDERDDAEQTGAAQRAKLAQAQHDRPVPRRGDLDRARHDPGHRDPCPQDDHPTCERAVPPRKVTEHQTHRGDREEHERGERAHHPHPGHLGSGSRASDVPRSRRVPVQRSLATSRARRCSPRSRPAALFRVIRAGPARQPRRGRRIASGSIRETRRRRPGSPRATRRSAMGG